MKTLILFSILSLNLSSQAQSLENGMCFYLYKSDLYADAVVDFDSSYHLKYWDNKFEIRSSKDSSLIFNQTFDGFPVYAGNSYFKAHQGDQVFIFNPDKKTIKAIDPKLKPLYEFNDIAVIPTSLSNDTLIRLNINVFLNKNGELIFDRDWYAETTHSNKKYVITSEIDILFETEGYLDQIPVEDYDDDLKKNILMRDMKNNFLNKEEFDVYQDYYDGYDNYSSGEKYNERYYLIRKNKKYGVLSSVGKYVIPAMYDEIEFMDNEYLADKGTYLTIKAFIGKTCYVFNTQGKLMFQNKNLEMESYPYNTDDLGVESQFLGHEIRNGKKRGLIHSTGEVVIPPLYDSYDYFDFYGQSFIDTPENLNEKAMPCEYYPFSQYFVGINTKTRERDFYAPNGQFLKKYKMDYLNEYNSFGYLSYELDGLYGLIGSGACEIKKAEYAYIEPFRGFRNIFVVTQYMNEEGDEETYLIDGTGTKLFGSIFNYVIFADTSHAIVSTTEGVGLMDVLKSERSIVWKLKPEFSHLEVLPLNNPYRRYNGYKYYIFSKNGESGIIDTDAKIIVSAKYRKIYLRGNDIYTVKNNKMGLLSSQFTTLLENSYDTIYPINGVVYLVKQNNKYALYDRVDQKLRTTFDFEEIQIKDTYYPYFTLKKNGKWGVMTDSYTWLIEPKYVSIKYDPISREHECLREDGKKDCFFIK